MDQKTRELVEAAERHAELPDNYDVAEHARDDVPELCAVIREQAAENEQLRAALKDRDETIAALQERVDSADANAFGANLFCGV